jgi:uncharacterized Zn finger protein
MNPQLTCEGCGAWLPVLPQTRRRQRLEDVTYRCGNCGQLNRFARIEIVPKQTWTIVRAEPLT